VRRRLVLILVALTVLAPVAWGVRWWWRATHPEVPHDTPVGWVPAVVSVDGIRGELEEPFGVALSDDGTVFAAESGDRPAIWRVGVDGSRTLVAGGVIGFQDGPGARAHFDTPSHLALGPDGALYVADTGNHAIRRVAPDGVVTTIAGDGTPGAGEGTAARLNGPVGVAASADGRVLVADTYNDRIVRLTPSADGASRWTVALVAGGDVPGLVDGAGADARFDTPSGLVALADGSLVVADTGNDVLRRVSADGTVTMLEAVDFTGSASVLWRPLGVAAGSGGRLYVTDSRTRVVEVIPDGTRRVLAGGRLGFSDGIGTAARFRDPAGIASNAAGRVAVADFGNGLVRVLDLPQRLGALPPLPPTRVPGFDLGLFARVPLVWPVEPQDGPHEIAGTMGEPRGNPGGDGRERFHAGVDVRAEQGTPVRAVRAGRVTSVLPAGSVNTLSEYLTIGPVTYVHIRAGRGERDEPVADWATVIADEISGRPARVRVRRGTRIAAGELIGTVNRFHHVHLNVGPPGEEHNALLVGLPGVVDTVAPLIAPRGVTLTDLQGQPLEERERGRVVVRGPVRIVVEAFDQMDDSPVRRRLGLYRVGYQVLDENGAVIPSFVRPHVAVEFDRLPGDEAAPPALYAPGSGIPFYGSRVTRYRYLVTARVDGDRVVEAPWDASVPPGDYLIRALAADAAGNVATRGTDLPIVVRP
jgi:DNA-binding beta-propeller fold protein YncE